MAMDELQMSDLDSVAGSESNGKSESTIPKTYDFAIVHIDKDKELAERFFLVLEEKYDLKGYHSKRDFVVGGPKCQRFRAWEDSRFIILLISLRSSKDKIFQKDRNIAYQVESKRTKSNNPEVLPIYVDLSRKEQRKWSTKVGRSFLDTVPFWEELAAHIDHSSCVESSSEISVESKQDDSSSEAQVDLTNNNNDPSEKTPPVKGRKKHKIFRGLFKRNEKKLKRKLKSTSSQSKKSKSGKLKSKKKLKSLRRLMICVPARSTECSSYSSPQVSSPPISTFHSPDTAKVDEMEHNFVETASRVDTTTAEHLR